MRALFCTRKRVNIVRPPLYAVSCSGGKDSAAMLLLMIERGMPIDMVLVADTGMEFPEMYQHWDTLEQHLYKKRGLKLTILRSPHSFEWFMFDQPKQKPSALERRSKEGVPPYGNGWPSTRVRWCTGQLKVYLINKELARLNQQYEVFQFIGIATDEDHRCVTDEHLRYPLVRWDITEAQALQICYDRGFNWGGLYEIYERCSCWCCPLQQIGELRKLRRHHPELWVKLMELDQRALDQFGHTPLGRFKDNWTIAALDERFAAEDRELYLFSDREPKHKKRRRHRHTH